MSSKKQVIYTDVLPKKIIDGATYIIEQSNPNSYTHGMFKYPCKFIPEIPRWAIKKYANNSNAIIFDPFSGSGTTLLEANVNGLNAFGTEIDDIAKLIIKVKTTRLSNNQIEQLDSIFNELILIIYKKDAPIFIPSINNLAHWFSIDAIDQLGRMKIFIDNINNVDIRDFFKLCMVSIVKRVSNADDASPKPYVSKKIIKDPPTVQKMFTSVFNRYKKMLIETNRIEKFGKTVLLEGDALHFKIPEIDLAITSPPYINAFDYGRTLRLENLWLGTLTEESLRQKKSQYVGTEKINLKKEKENLNVLDNSELLKQYFYKILEKDVKRAFVVKKFFEDMEENLKLVYKYLNMGGKYILVIGDSKIRNVNVESWKVLDDLATNIGFVKKQYFNYIIQNPYIRIPRKNKGGKISKDNILVLEKR